MKESDNISDDPQLDATLALLIVSTHSKKRPTSLMKIAQEFEVAKQRLGSYKKVGDRIGLSITMVRQFASLLKLVPSVQELFVERKLDSIDAAVHLSLLPAKDQLPVAEALAASEIDTADVRGIVQLRRAGAVGDIGALTRKVSDSKTKQEYVAQFVVRGSQDPERVRQLFAKYIGKEDIIRLHLDGALGTLVLSPRGKRSLTHLARSKKVPLRKIIPTIMQEGA
jgi:hypothetical protein